MTPIEQLRARLETGGVHLDGITEFLEEQNKLLYQIILNNSYLLSVIKSASIQPDTVPDYSSAGMIG